MDPIFLDISEPECEFTGKVVICGVAYLAKNHLILELKVKATVQMPCSICNEKFEIPIEVEPFTQTVEICEIKSAIYDFTEDIRHAILLKVPQFVECHQGNCPHRKTINKFLKQFNLKFASSSYAKVDFITSADIRHNRRSSS